jgi:hypothetical protein
MKKIRSSMVKAAPLAVAILLAGCVGNPFYPETGGHGQHDGHTVIGSTGDDFTVDDRSTDTEISFLVRKNGGTFTDYGINHAKEMHVIVVRDDLRHFVHLHPERDDQGVWHVAYEPTVGGMYWFYADFVSQDGTQHLVRFERTYPGDKGEYGLMKNPEMVKTYGPYKVQLPSVPTIQKNLSFVYIITDEKDQQVPLETYLDAVGHSVLISAKGDYLHAHAQKTEYGDPEFLVPDPKENFYRAFTQFQIDGEVMTIEFDWDRSGMIQ